MSLISGLWPYFVAWSIALFGLGIGLYLFSHELGFYLVGERWIPEPVNHIANFFDSYDLSAPILYALFYGVANSLFLPGFILVAAAGLLFDPYVGIVVVMVGLFLASQTFYWLGRWGGESVLNFFSERTTELVFDYMPQRTGRVVLLCRLVFFMPFHAFNAASGVLKVPWLSYSLATVIGLFPRMFVYFYIGISLRPGGNITLAAIYLLLLIVIESLYGALLLQFYLKHQS
jgi:uncharacterized membrane protein YdjX (TVP38/TMEM64 family)